MGINFETAIEMQRICTGETRELSRGQIAEEVLDIDNIVKSFGPEKAEKCRVFYEGLISDQEKKPYDVELLLEETENLKKAMDDFLTANSDDDSFMALFEAVSEFFMVPPFEGLDNIEYGVNEVCVLSVLEYFKWKTSHNHEHEKIRKDYRDDIAARTYEEVGDHWIGVYDDLQRRYDKICADDESENALMYKIAGCSIIAISAIKDQDSFALDMVQVGAETKGRSIVDEYLAETYEEGESIFTDNVIRLMEFVWRYIETQGE